MFFFNADVHKARVADIYFYANGVMVKACHDLKDSAYVEEEMTYRQLTCIFAYDLGKDDEFWIYLLQPNSIRVDQWRPMTFMGYLLN